MSSSLLSINSQDDPTALVPKEWHHNQLGKICDIHGGGRLGLTKEKHYRSSGVLAFSAAGPDGFVEQTEFQGKAGVVLSAIGAKCGRCFFAFGDWTTLANVQAIIPNSEVDAKYLFYVVNRDGYWDRSGSAQPFIKPSTIRSSWVAYPRDISEQTKIAEILSTVDQAIEQTEALIAKQQRIKTGLMQDLLTRGIDENGNLRSEETHEFKDSPLGRIPVEWESGPLFERRLIGRPHLKTGPFGSSLKLEHWRPTGVPVITIGALGAGSLINSELLYVSESTAMRLQNYRLEVGDIVFSRVADVGRSAVISIDQRGWIMSSNLMCISLDLKQVNAYFLQAQLSYESRIRQQILSSVNAGGRDVANTEILNSLQFLWPPLTEQTRIMDCLKALDGRIDCAVKELGKLSQVKTALMQDLLTGKVSVAPLLTDTEGSTGSD